VDHLLGDIVVSVDGDGLAVSIPTLDALGYTVDASMTSYFSGVWAITIDGVPYEVTFVDGPDGTPTWLRDRLFVGTRATASMAPRTTPAPTRAQVDALFLRARLDDAPSPLRR
jgi:hypothetical protein